MIDKSTYKVVTNGIEDWIAYGIIDPTMLVPEIMHPHYQVYDQEGEPMFDLTGLKVIDVCWSTLIGEQTLIRLGSRIEGKGTLITEFEFDNWLACVPEGAVALDQIGYRELLLENQPEEI